MQLNQPFPKRLLAIPALAMLLAANTSAPRNYALDESASQLTGKVAFFGLGSKTMTFPKMDGRITVDPKQISNASINVTFDATALTASDDLTRDRLKGDKFFWVEKHPTVRFSGSSLKLTTPTKGTFTGTLTARGISKPQTLNVVFDQDPVKAAPGAPVGFTATTTIDRRQYNMKAFQLIVGNKVKIRMKARMVPR